MKRILILLIAVVLLFVWIGCDLNQFQPEWNEKFEKNTYGCRNTTDAYYLGSDGVYRKSDSSLLFSTDQKPVSVCANDEWVVCLVQGDKTGGENNRIFLYQIDTQKTHTVSTKVSYKEDLLLCENNVLLIFASESFLAYDLNASEFITLPILWQTPFRMESFDYQLTVYQLADGALEIIKRNDVMGSDYTVTSKQGNLAEERGVPVLAATENEAILSDSFVSNDGSFSVFKVNATGTCEKLISIPKKSDPGDSTRYQIGPCHHLSDGSHALTLRKMSGWHPAYVPREKMYDGDRICVFSPDWTSFRMIDLGEKKLIGSENGSLFYLEGNTLYRTTADGVIENSFEQVGSLPRKWTFIAFSAEEYTVFE